MRTIKFRAWDKEKKKMYYKDLIIGNYAIGSHEFGPKKPNEVILMQYIGLKDKNGKEIFEGDLIGEEGFVLSVEFHDGCFTVGNAQPLIEWLNGRSRRQDDTFVIGNIYENKNLTQ